MIFNFCIIFSFRNGVSAKQKSWVTALPSNTVLQKGPALNSNDTLQMVFFYSASIRTVEAVACFFHY